MNTFEVIYPPVLLAPYVKQYWFLTMENRRQEVQRLVPIGCMALLFHRGNRTHSSLENEYLPHSYWQGIAKEYTDLTFSGAIDLIGIVFQPAAGKLFFSMPPGELRNSYLPLDLLNDPGLRELEHQLQDIPDSFSCIQVIERFLLHRLNRASVRENKRMNTVLHAIHSGKADVERLAALSCLGYKQFKRHFYSTMGINPKEYLQIIRFQKVHRLLQLHTGLTVTQLAYECGYYDKSHLIREVKEHCGFTPTELLKACDPVYSSYHGLFRSAFIDLPSV
ncbi:MAG: AraC family transcriptional regulator [Tannerellaceae bacterium]|nr:AraC family transcriptional regulator [Tannerellaceae bacterium]